MTKSIFERLLVIPPGIEMTTHRIAAALDVTQYAARRYAEYSCAAGLAARRIYVNRETTFTFSSSRMPKPVRIREQGTAAPALSRGSDRAQTRLLVPDVLVFIREPRTVLEIQKEFGIIDYDNAYYMLSRLVRDGLVNQFSRPCPTRWQARPPSAVAG